MSETVTIPKAEYDRLRALEEDFSDIQTALAVEARLATGEEELIPAEVVDRLLDGEPPLRVWREFRNLTQSELARASGVNRVQIVDIEADRNSGSVRTLRKLADALVVTVDDLISSVDQDHE
ncbi:MAG: helix-turn-helix transcriptional regulator [Spirochaetaceae bacterium]|nr:helix-turn-helix transcriptional regulator [Spirochaetaceae bacterium]